MNMTVSPREAVDFLNRLLTSDPARASELARNGTIAFLNDMFDLAKDADYWLCIVAVYDNDDLTHFAFFGSIEELIKGGPVFQHHSSGWVWSESCLLSTVPDWVLRSVPLPVLVRRHDVAGHATRTPTAAEEMAQTAMCRAELSRRGTGTV